MSIDDEERSSLQRALDAQTIRILESRARTKRRWRWRRRDESKSAADIEAAARELRKALLKQAAERLNRGSSASEVATTLGFVAPSARIEYEGRTITVVGGAELQSCADFLRDAGFYVSNWGRRGRSMVAKAGGEGCLVLLGMQDQGAVD